VRRKKNLQDFLTEVGERQDNLVFPKTVDHETDAFRRLYAGKEPMTPLQWCAVVLLLMAVTTCLIGMLSVWVQTLIWGRGTFVERLVGVLMNWLVVLVPLGVFFYLLRRSLLRKK
jgi:hypothetical protein